MRRSRMVGEFRSALEAAAAPATSAAALATDAEVRDLREVW